jgi:hypothetical protein
MGGINIPDDDRDVDDRKSDTSRERDQSGRTGGSESGRAGQEKERGDQERAHRDKEGRDAPFREPDKGPRQDDDLADTGTSDALGGASRRDR